MSRRYVFDVKTYIKFMMFSTPLIDLMNGLLGGHSSFGQAVRSLLVAFNIFIIFTENNNKARQSTLLLLFIFGFNTIIFTINYSMVSLSTNVAYFMKLLLFFTQVHLLIIEIDKERISEVDFDKFWNYSFFIIPVSLLITKLMGIGTQGIGGLFSSINAISIILVVQIILLFSYAQRNYRYWILLAVNVIAVLMMGRKSPLLFIAFSFLVIMLFQSKHRLKFIIITILGLAIVYYVVGHYLQNQWNELLGYQEYWYREAKNSGNWSNFIFSGRNNLLSSTWNELKHRGLLLIAILYGLSPFGLGKVTSISLGLTSLRGIEMDPVEIMLSYGVVAVIMLYSIFIKSLKWKINNKDNLLIINLAIICALIHSIFGGHTITEAVGAAYSSYLIAYKYCLSLGSKDGKNKQAEA